MSDPFLAEIRIFPFNFPPKGWAFCDGQIMPLSQNTALFSLLGTTYGGDGKSTFALPNLQGMAAMHPGQGPGLSLRDLGEEGGEQAVTLLQSEMPVHNHTMNATSSPSTTTLPDATTSFGRSAGGSFYKATPFGALAQFGQPDLPVTGGSQPHNNMQPYLTLNFCIALQGIFPPRT